MYRFGRFCLVTAFEESAPRTQPRSIAHGKSHFLQDSFVQSLSLHQNRHFVDSRCIDALYNGFFVYIAEKGHFLAQGVAQLMFRAEYQHIGLDTGALQLFYGVLGRFGFQFAGCCKIGYISKVYAQGVFTQFPFQLADAFQVRKRLDVAYRTTDFGNYEIEFIFVAQQLYITLDFIRNVRDYLNGLSQIIAAALFVDNAFIDTSGCNIVGLCGLDTQEAFVVSQVEIGFMAVYRYVAFSVLIRVQRTRVDIDIRVELLNCYFITSCLQ